MTKQKMFERTLSDLNNLADSEAIRKKKWIHQIIDIFAQKKLKN